jgi:uncharacterized membrane protein YfcA
MGFSGDWRDTGWGHVVYLGVIPTAITAAVATDHGYRPVTRISAAVLSVLFGFLVLYAVLRVLKLIPFRKGRRRRSPEK